MVLITNRQSNILQDIDSLHLFAQVVTSICKSLDEIEILRNAYELLSAFDEVVTLGYRENLSLSQIKTFLEMESHEERIQEIISRVHPSLSCTIVRCSVSCRTKNSKRQKNVRERPNSSSSNARKRYEMAVAPLLEPHPTPRTPHLHEIQVSAPTILMRRRRTNHSSLFTLSS